MRYITLRDIVNRLHAFRVHVALGIIAGAAIVVAIVYALYKPVSYVTHATLLVEVPESMIVDEELEISSYVAGQWNTYMSGSLFRIRMIRALPALEKQYENIPEYQAKELWSEQLKLVSTGKAGIIRVEVRADDQVASVQLLRRFLSAIPELKNSTTDISYSIIDGPTLEILRQ